MQKKSTFHELFVAAQGQGTLANTFLVRAGLFVRIVMRITILQATVAMIFSGLAMAHTNHAQELLDREVSVNAANLPLNEVLDKVGASIGIKFAYSPNHLELAEKITVHATSKKLGELLNELLTPREIEYHVQEGTNFIVLKKIRERYVDIPIEPSTNGSTQDESALKVSGSIKSKDGTPLPGVNIIVKGTTAGTTSNAEGKYGIDAGDNDVLVFSFIGFKPAEELVGGRAIIDVTMDEDVTTLQEVQINAGYYTITERTKVGAITRIDAKDLQKQPVNNIFLALQGRVPGLIITPTSGAPGASVKMQIRGQNTLPMSINGFTFDQPLIIIDGVPFAAQNQNINLIPSGGGGYAFAAPNQGFGALSNINPNDIESITVLKDADATSIYGSQGANGVILITTRKGTPGKTRLNVRMNSGPNRLTRRTEYMNTQQYIELRREGIANDGLTLPPAFDGMYPDLQLFDTTRYTNWSDKFFNGTANNTDVNISLSGGSNRVSFMMSGGYSKTTYNFPGGFSDKRYSLHSGINYESANGKLSMNYASDFSYSGNNNTAFPEITGINALPPNTPELLDENGDLLWSYKGYDLGFQLAGSNTINFQPYAYLKQAYKLNKYNFNNSLRVSYKLFAGLDAAVNLGYNRFTTGETSQYPIGAQSPNAPYGRYGTANFARNDFETLNIEPQLTYERRAGSHEITVTAGATYKKNINQSERIEATEYTNDGFLGSLTGAGRITTAVSNNLIYKYVGVFGRIGYIYKDKYILNVTGRRDGSSNFGPGKRFGTFAAAGAGWIVSEESFFAKLKPAVSMFKLSANYGTNGSDGVEPYNYQDYWVVPQDFFGATPYQGSKPYNPYNPYNPDYSWALKKTLNAMVDIGLLNDRLQLNITRYVSRTGNQLISVLLPSQTGFQALTDNLDATVENAGWELTFVSTNIKTENFNWITTITGSRSRNTLVAFPGLELSPYGSFFAIGKSLSMINGFKYKGVNTETGLFEFYDAEGNVTSTDLDYNLAKYGGDAVPIMDLQPGFNGGIDNRFSWKGLSLSIYFQFIKQEGLNYLAAVYGASQPGMIGNQPALVADHWRKPGDQSELQRATSTYGDPSVAASFFRGSTGSYSDASFMRLKTLTLSYDFPSALVSKIGMEGLTGYVTAQNLLTFTNYKFGDPETPGQLGLPLQRMYTFGLSFNF